MVVYGNMSLYVYEISPYFDTGTKLVMGIGWIFIIDHRFKVNERLSIISSNCILLPVSNHRGLIIMIMCFSKYKQTCVCQYGSVLHNRQMATSSKT